MIDFIYESYRQKTFAVCKVFRYNLVEQTVKVLPEFVKIITFVIESRKRCIMLKWLDENLEEFLMVALLIAMTVIMGIQVFARYALGASLSWSEELTRYLFIWSGFISVSYCTKKCISIKIEQFVAMFPRRGKALFKVVNHTIELALFLYLIPYAVLYLKSAFESGQVSPACQIPMYYIQAAPLFSFVLVAFRIVQRWIIEFKIVIRKDEEKEEK